MASSGMVFMLGQMVRSGRTVTSKGGDWAEPLEVPTVSFPPGEPRSP
jgi:hypothetical protein